MGLFQKFRELFGDTSKPSDFKTAPPSVPEKDADDLVVEAKAPETRPESVSEKHGGIRNVEAMIEYTDSKGQSSRRRIRMSELSRSKNGDLMVSAYCFERKAKRSFRLDRMDCVIDIDGEVHEPEKFFFEVMQVDAPSTKTKTKKGAKQINALWDSLTLLVGLGRSDGYLDDDEIGEILTYVENACLDLGIECKDSDLDAVEQYIERYYPDEQALEEALDSLEQRDETFISEVSHALRYVVEADGIIDSKELDFLLALGINIEVG